MLVLLALLATPALAEDTPDWADKSGALGIGSEVTLGGTAGLNIRTYVTPLFGLHLTLGFGMQTVSAEPETGADVAAHLTRTEFRVAPYASYKLAYWQRGNLSAVFGVDVRTLTASVGDGQDSSVDLLMGLGLMGEYFPTQYLSLWLAAGLTLDFLGDDAGVGTTGFDPAPNTYALDLAGAPLGTAGFTVWFK